MKILVLGGTRFVGRHIIDRLASAHHEVTCFHRGQTACEFGANIDERLGDRNVDLSTIENDHWDVVIDVNCYEPEQMQKSLRLHTNRYVFISTVNVYADVSKPGATEEWPTITAFDPSDEAAAYGGKKAACERLLLARFGESATILRPGMIVGKWDPTGRFTYWCDRISRGGDFLVPGPPDRPVQFIDARDLADFAALTIEHESSGAFNIVGPPETCTMADLVHDCEAVAAERGAGGGNAVWADGSFLLQQEVEPWIEMPLWLPQPNWAGVLCISNVKAVSAGLQHRPTTDTISSVLDWLSAAPGAKVAGLAGDRESALLQKLISVKAR